MLFRCLLVTFAATIAFSLLESTRFFQLCVKPPLPSLLKSVGAKPAVNRALHLSTQRAFYRISARPAPQGQAFVKAKRPMAQITRFFFAFTGQRSILLKPYAHFWWRVASLRALSPARLRQRSGHPAFGTSTSSLDVYSKALWLRPFFFLLGRTKRHSSFFASSCSVLTYFLFDSSRKVLHFFFFTTFVRWEKPTPTPLKVLSLTNRLTFFEFLYLNLSVWRTLPWRTTSWPLEQYALTLTSSWQQRGSGFWLRRVFLTYFRGVRKLSFFFVEAWPLGLLGAAARPGEYALSAYSRCLMARRAYSHGRVAAVILSFLLFSCVRMSCLLFFRLWQFFVFILLRLTVHGQMLLSLWLCLPWSLQLRTLLRYLGLAALAWCEWKYLKSLTSLVCLLPLLTTFFLPLQLGIGAHACLMLQKQLLGLSLCLALRAYKLLFFFQSALLPLFAGLRLGYYSAFSSVRVATLRFLTWHRTAATALSAAFIKLTPLAAHAGFFFWGLIYSVVASMRPYGLFFVAANVALCGKFALIRYLQAFRFCWLVVTLFCGLWYHCCTRAGYAQAYVAAMLSLYLNLLFFAIAVFLTSTKLSGWRLCTYAIELSQLPYESLAAVDALALLILNFFLRCLLSVKLCNPAYAGYYGFSVGRARPCYVVAVLQFHFFYFIVKHTLGSTSPSLRTFSFFFVQGCGESYAAVQKTLSLPFILSTLGVVKVAQFRQPSFFRGLRRVSSFCLAALCWLQDFVLDSFEEEIRPYCLRFYQDVTRVLTSPQLARRCLRLRLYRAFWPFFGLELAHELKLQGRFFNFFFFSCAFVCAGAGLVLLCSFFTKLYLALLSFSLSVLAGFFFFYCLHVHWLFLACLGVFIFKVLTRSCVQVKRATVAFIAWFYAAKLVGFASYATLFLTRVSSTPFGSSMAAQSTCALSPLFKAICAMRFAVSASFCYWGLNYLHLLSGFMQLQLFKVLLLLVLTLLWTFRLNRQMASLVDSKSLSGKRFVKVEAARQGFFYWPRLIFFASNGWALFVTSLGLAVLFLGWLSSWNLFFVSNLRCTRSSQTLYALCLLSWVFVTLTAALTAVLQYVYRTVVLGMPKAALAHRLTQRVLAGGIFLIILVLWLLLMRALLTWGAYLNFVADSRLLQDLLVSRYFYWVRGVQFTYLFFAILIAPSFFFLRAFFYLRQRVRTQLLITEARPYLRAYSSFFVFYWVPGAVFYFFMLGGSVIFTIVEVTRLVSYWYPGSSSFLQKARTTRANAHAYYWTYRYASFPSLKKLKLQQWGLRRAALTRAGLPHGVGKERSAWFKLLETGTKLKFRYNSYSWAYGYGANQVVRRQRVKHPHRLLRWQQATCPAYAEALNLPQRTKFLFTVKLFQSVEAGGLAYAMRVPAVFLGSPSLIGCPVGLKPASLKLWKPLSAGVVFLQHPLFFSRANASFSQLPASSRFPVLPSCLAPLPLQALVFSPTRQLAGGKLAVRPCSYISLIQLWRINRLLTFTLTKKHSWSLPTFFPINQFFNTGSFLKELRVLLYGDEEDYENILELGYWALPTLRFNDFLTLRRYSSWPSPSKARTFAAYDYRQQLLSIWSSVGRALVPLAKAYSPLAYRAFRVCPWPAHRPSPPFSTPKLEFAAWSPIFPRLLTLRSVELTGAFIKFQKAFKGARDALAVPRLPAYNELLASDERALRLRRLWSKHHRRLAGVPFCRPYALYVVGQPVTWQWPVTQAKPGILWYLPEALKTYNNHWLRKLWGSRRRSYQSTGIYGQLFELLPWLRLPSYRYSSSWVRYVSLPHQHSPHLAYAGWKKALPAPSLLSLPFPPVVELGAQLYPANLLGMRGRYSRAVKFARVPFAQKSRFFFFFTLQPELGSRFSAYTIFFQPWSSLYLWQRPYFFLRLTPAGDTVRRMQQPWFCLPEHSHFFVTFLDNPLSEASYAARLRSRFTFSTVTVHDYYKDYKQAFLNFYARTLQSGGTVSSIASCVVFPPALKSLSTFFISAKAFNVRLSANGTACNLLFPLRAGTAWDQRQVWEGGLCRLRAYKTMQILAKSRDCLFLHPALKVHSSCTRVSRLYAWVRLRKLSTMHSQVTPNFALGQTAWPLSPWALSYRWRVYASPAPVSLSLRLTPRLTFQPCSAIFLKQWQAYVSYAACVASWGGAGSAHLQNLTCAGLQASELDRDGLILTRDQRYWKKGFFGVDRYSRFAFWDVLTSVTFRAYLATPTLKRAYSTWWWERFYKNWPLVHWLAVNLSLQPRVLAYCFWLRQYPSSLKGLIDLYGVCLESPELVPRLPWKLKRQLLPEEHVFELRALRKKKIFSQSWRSRW